MRLIDPIAFRIRKALFGDQYLSRFSVPEAELLSWLDGKTVALVGNSRGLSAQALGTSIDDHDIVIRLNDAPIVAPKSHGSRTDWLVVAKTVSPKVLEERSPTVLLWMPAKRKRLTWGMMTFDKFHLGNSELNGMLRNKLGAPSSVGCLAIFLVQKSRALNVDLYGFDFFASRSLSGSRTKGQVPHDFDAEKHLVLGLLKEDSRFKLQT